jgi:hypothetical protein
MFLYIITSVKSAEFCPMPNALVFLYQYHHILNDLMHVLVIPFQHKRKPQHLISINWSNLYWYVPFHRTILLCCLSLAVPHSRTNIDIAYAYSLQSLDMEQTYTIHLFSLLQDQNSINGKCICQNLNASTLFPPLPQCMKFWNWIICGSCNAEMYACIESLPRIEFLLK